MQTHSVDDKLFSTQHHLIDQDPLYTLRYFKPERIEHPPVFIVYSLINRAYILDLHPSHSYISHFLHKGQAVYLMDWHYDRKAPIRITLESYLIDKLKPAFEKAQIDAQTDKLDLIGICQGGNLALMLTSLISKQVQSLTLLNTAIDFQTDEDVISKLIRKMDYKQFIEAVGDISGAMLTQFFIGLRPFHFLMKTIASRDSNLQHAFEHWLMHPPDLAAQALIDFIDTFYMRNSLLKGPFKLGNTIIDLTNIDVIPKVLSASEDHITPTPAAFALASLIPCETHQVKGGHIGVLLTKINTSEAASISGRVL